MEICEDFFHTEAEHVDRPRNKWRTGEICCNRMRSVSSIRSAMASRALQDIVLNIPDWARLDHTDSMPPLPNPLPKKRSAEASLTAEVPSKRSKCDVMRTCATQVFSKTNGCQGRNQEHFLGYYSFGGLHWTLSYFRRFLGSFELISGGMVWTCKSLYTPNAGCFAIIMYQMQFMVCSMWYIRLLNSGGLITYMLKKL